MIVLVMADTTHPSVLGRRATAAGLIVLAQENAADSVRVAIQEVAGTKPPTMKILQKQNPLVNIVKELCKEWGLQNPEEYQLQFDEMKVTPPPIYITEENREKMMNGHILKLDFSPQKMSHNIAERLENSNISVDHIKRLAFLSADITFVEHFVTENGFIALNKYVINLPTQGQLLAMNGPALQAFLNIMGHSIVSWETISMELLNSVVWHLDEKHRADSLVIKSALSIIESAILNSSLGKSLAVESKFKVNQFISTLKAVRTNSSKDVEIQVSCISLINTLLSVSSPERQQQIRKQLLSNPIRQVVWESIFTAPIGPEMAHQLYSLQTRLVNLLSDRLHGAIKITDPAAMQEVTDLRKIAFDDEGEGNQRGSNSDTRDFTKLGFKNPSQPLSVSAKLLFITKLLDCG